MERPVSFSAEDIRDEKVRPYLSTSLSSREHDADEPGARQVKVLRYIPEIKPEDVLLGQYVAKDDKPGYLDDETVPKGSICPTFAACVVHINSPRWEGVPFILKAGKALNEQKAEVRIQYKDVTQGIFKEITRNELVIRVQPNEAVYLKMNSKAPGLAMRTVPTEMDLTYKRRFSDLKIPEAYECVFSSLSLLELAAFVVVVLVVESAELTLSLSPAGPSSSTRSRATTRTLFATTSSTSPGSSSRRCCTGSTVRPPFSLSTSSMSLTDALPLPLLQTRSPSPRSTSTATGLLPSLTTSGGPRSATSAARRPTGASSRRSLALSPCPARARVHLADALSHARSWPSTSVL